jgi:hypothetical protein
MLKRRSFPTQQPTLSNLLYKYSLLYHYSISVPIYLVSSRRKLGGVSIVSAWYIDIGNLRDQVVAVLLLLESTEGHLGARDVLLWVLEVLEESVGVPGDSLLLVGIGVRVTLDGAGLAAEETVEVGADLVGLSVTEGVALCATGLEEVGTLL